MVDGLKTCAIVSKLNNAGTSSIFNKNIYNIDVAIKYSYFTSYRNLILSGTNRIVFVLCKVFVDIILGESI